MNKITQSNSNCNGSDTDMTAVDDDSNVLNLSRRRNSDTTNCNGKCLIFLCQISLNGKEGMVNVESFWFSLL